MELPIQQGSTQNEYQEYDVTIAAGAFETLFEVHDYFRVLALSNTTLSVQFGQNGRITKWSGAGIGKKHSGLLDRVKLINTGGAPITVTVALAIGSISDDRLNISGNVNVVTPTNTPLLTKDTNSTAFTTPQVALAATTATQIFASNSSAKARIIKAGNTDLYIGTSNAVTNSNGFKIDQGQSAIIPHGLAVWGYTLSADTVFTYEETY